MVTLLGVTRYGNKLTIAIKSRVECTVAQVSNRADIRRRTIERSNQRPKFFPSLKTEMLFTPSRACPNSGDYLPTGTKGIVQ